MEEEKELRKEFRKFVKPAQDKGFYKTKYNSQEYNETYAWISDIEDYWVEKIEKYITALDLILPLAKGYVAKNQVGSNQIYIEVAEKLLRKKGKELIINKREI